MSKYWALHCSTTYLLVSIFFYPIINYYIELGMIAVQFTIHKSLLELYSMIHTLRTLARVNDGSKRDSLNTNRTF